MFPAFCESSNPPIQHQAMTDAPCHSKQFVLGLREIIGKQPKAAGQSESFRKLRFGGANLTEFHRRFQHFMEHKDTPVRFRTSVKVAREAFLVGSELKLMEREWCLQQVWRSRREGGKQILMTFDF